ncbi:MAG: response regulator transcription factor [Erysipelotrichaceae bacterium]|nr:response regulator transcription factor [Erysipelotrichaceae bacterium]
MIACVEDEESIREIEIYTLKSAGYDAAGFVDGNSFFAALSKEKMELVILDVMLPDIDGIEILKKLKKDASTRNIPVIIASAKGTEFDKIKGLDLGADDYLAKPFGMMEMLSRIKAVTRRSNTMEENTVIGKEQIQILTRQHQVFVNHKEVALTYKEYEVLKMLMSHPGIVYTREELLDAVWGMEYDGETRTVDVHIRTLRAKLKEAGDTIDTVRGVGYRYKEAL